MDPNETLAQLRRMSEEPRWLVNPIAAKYIEHFEALDSWLSNGGFLPEDWRKRRP
jgi:hypothetical protein